MKWKKPWLTATHNAVYNYFNTPAMPLTILRYAQIERASNMKLDKYRAQRKKRVPVQTLQILVIKRTRSIVGEPETEILKQCAMSDLLP